MYNVIKSVIAAGGFKLAEIQYRIKKLYAQGDLTEEQMDELLAAASDGVSANAERPETLQMLRDMSDRMDELEKRLSALDGIGGEEPSAYPAWQRWDGISDQYRAGAIVSHGGKLWQSVYVGQNVWEPGAAGIDDRFWIEYTAG